MSNLYQFGGLRSLMDQLTGSPRWTLFLCPQQFDSVKETLELNPDISLEGIDLVASDNIKFGWARLMQNGCIPEDIKLNALYNIMELC